MSKVIPDWAIEEAFRRLDRSDLSVSAVRPPVSPYGGAILLAAELIAKHEEPPVDPLQEAVIEALGALRAIGPLNGILAAIDFEHSNPDGPAFIAELRKRGVTIGGAS